MARIKIAYVGGGGTRGPGTMASFIHQAKDNSFADSDGAALDIGNKADLGHG